MSYIYKIFKEYKCLLLLIYFYAFVAQLLFLFEPYVLGKMIDGLLVKNYNWLFVFLSVEIIANIFIYKRMVFDTKVYLRIYNDVIFEYLRRDENNDPSVKIARTDMTNSIINFFENDVQYYIMAVMTIIGSVFFIFLGDVKTGFIVSLAVMPICFIVMIFYKKIEQSTKVGNNHYEQKISILAEGDKSEVHTFFERRRKILIFSSTLQGKNWSSLNASKTIFLIVSLVIFTNGNINLTQGQAVSMYAYINQFLISLMSIPVGMETFTRIRDVIGRIKE